ncbi:neuropeptide Y receptor type 2-like protein, partial [Dinothrombium tinctorium]
MDNTSSFNDQTERNLTFALQNMFDKESLYEVPNHLIVLLTVAYGAVSLSAIIGNGIVLWYVVRSKKLRTVTNMFIANLAIADILIGALAIPFQFQAALLQKWVLPHFMCAFCPFIQIVSVNVSIFTLTAIAADRYLVVIHPINQRITKNRARLLIFIIWTIAVIAAIPAAIALRVQMVPELDEDLMKLWLNVTLFEAQNITIPTKPFCDNIKFDTKIWMTYNLALVVIQYFLPLAIITFAYGKMGFKLREGRNRSIRVHYTANVGSFRKSDSTEEVVIHRNSKDKCNSQAEYIVANKKK